MPPGAIRSPVMRSMPTSVRLDPLAVRALKLLAARDGTTAGALIRDAVLDRLDREIARTREASAAREVTRPAPPQWAPPAKCEARQ